MLADQGVSFLLRRPSSPGMRRQPLRFKFSWSPRGALLSQFNSASYLQDGKVVEISNQDLMAQAQPYHVADGIPEPELGPVSGVLQHPEAETVVRGSLRYEGNPSFVAALIKLGWLDTQPRAWLEKESGGLTLREVLGRIISAHGVDEESDYASYSLTDRRSLVARIDELCSFSDNVERERIISGLRWIGLFSEKPATLRGNPLDTLCAELERLLSFQPGERDLVMLQHKFVIQWEDGRKETRTSTLELLGDLDGYSAMAKSVGVTCGIATQLLLDGEPALNRPGVLAPYTTGICNPIRNKLEEEGIKLVEKSL
ncbi:saccharopine dehydrogenase [NADP(+), L-glutamate-forming] [Colletotrichum liriopes]|uniref:Saccharopine dehydrogenase [NADP(+), L-glutamate-forming] n=1 Tax=Colletotrichum liriopes TaxID=708192 RepID=A0AA37GF77_9PEZI|nr:saccharopine dehydrogenase [NADP(+), L-glutamate-forming] [Colletotrichum liriopes]